MTDESPLDLRSLGDVESPEVVRAALRRFRRNALRTAAWVAVVGLVAVTFALGASARRSLGDRIEGAPGFSPGAVYQVQGMTAVLAKVADLGRTVGLHFTVAVPNLHTYADARIRDTYSLNIAGARTVDSGDEAAAFYELWAEVDVPADGRISVEVERFCTLVSRSSGGCRVRDAERALGSFTVDLRVLGVPERIWVKR